MTHRQKVFNTVNIYIYFLSLSHTRGFISVSVHTFCFIGAKNHKYVSVSLVLKFQKDFINTNYDLVPILLKLVLIRITIIALFLAGYADSFILFIT